MSVFSISDLHLSLGEGIDKPMDIFGPNWENYELRLKEAWLDLITPEDTVIIQGDVSWGMHLNEAMADLMFVAELPGEKVILRGNHDLWWASHKKLNVIHPTLHFMHNEAYAGNGFVVVGSRGWLCPGARDFTESEDRKIYERELMRLNLSLQDAKNKLGGNLDDAVVLGAMHYSPVNEKKQPSGFTDFFSSIGARTVVYGHLHGEAAFANALSGRFDGVNYELCSLDKLNCFPKKVLDT